MNDNNLNKLMRNSGKSKLIGIGKVKSVMMNTIQLSYRIIISVPLFVTGRHWHHFQISYYFLPLAQ